MLSRANGNFNQHEGRLNYLYENKPTAPRVSRHAERRKKNGADDLLW
jgi:hypothetical protein